MENNLRRFGFDDFLDLCGRDYFSDGSLLLNSLLFWNMRGSQFPSIMSEYLNYSLRDIFIPGLGIETLLFKNILGDSFPSKPFDYQDYFGNILEYFWEFEE